MNIVNEQQTGLCGVSWERPMLRSELQRTDHDDYISIPKNQHLFFSNDNNHDLTS